MKILTAQKIEKIENEKGGYRKVTWDSGKTDNIFTETQIVQGKTYEVSYKQNPKNPKFWNVSEIKEASQPSPKSNDNYDATFEKQQKCIFLNTCLKAASEITAAAVGPFASRENIRPEDIDNFAISFYSKMAEKIISDFKGMLPFGSDKQAKIPEASGVYGRIEKTVEDPGL